MTIEKISKTSYRVKAMKNRKMYSIIFDHRPTKKEAEEALANKMIVDGIRPNGDLTFTQAAEMYVTMKKNVLSPNVVREYSLMPGRCSRWFAEMRIDDIDQVAINKQVNEWSSDKAPKTVANYHGFISAILGTFRPQMKIYTTLPQKRKIEPFIPSDDDVKRILEALVGTEYYVAVALGCYGLRRGEICALSADDVDPDGTVHIRQALAIDKDRNKVMKSTKTTDSERDIYIPQKLAEIIIKQGYVYKYKPGGINEKLHEVQDKLGIERFNLHKLRHYFASKMLTITDPKTVQALGGWKTDAVMKTVYAHSMKEEQEKAKRLAADTLGKSILIE